MWLLQKNIWNEYGYHRFMTSIEEQGIPFEEVHLIPFTENFEKHIDCVPKLIFGSGRFVNVCRMRGFPTFKSFLPYEKFYPACNWINGEGEDVKWGDLPNYDFSEPKFIKPYTEKFFTGRVFESVADLNKVQLATSFITNDNEELVRVSNAAIIRHEVRFYVIGGKIISGSLYRVDRRVDHRRIDKLHPAWKACEDILESGYIDDAFVIDLGCSEDHGLSWKIVELNNINSSGLYECDTDAIVRAFNQLTVDNDGN